MNRELIPGRKKRRFNGVLYKLTVADALTSSVKVLAALTWAEADRCGKVLWLALKKCQSGSWRCISASLGLARQKATPRGRTPSALEIPDKLLTPTQALLHPAHTHLPVPSSTWASTLDQHKKVSALGSRVDWTPVVMKYIHVCMYFMNEPLWYCLFFLYFYFSGLSLHLPSHGVAASFPAFIASASKNA